MKKLGQKIEELQAKASSSRSKASSSLLLDEEAQRKSAQQTIRATMSALLSRPEGVDAEGTQRIHELVRQFVENSRERQSQVETYLDRVEESLTPGLQSKFAMWGLDQNDDFYSKPGLWTSLMSKEIGLTPQQLATILSKRPAIHQERKNLATCELMIKELRAAAGQHLRSLHQTMDEVQTVMTPTQLAKFYLYVQMTTRTHGLLAGESTPCASKSPSLTCSLSAFAFCFPFQVGGEQRVDDADAESVARIQLQLRARHAAAVTRPNRAPTQTHTKRVDEPSRVNHHQPDDMIAIATSPHTASHSRTPHCTPHRCAATIFHAHSASSCSEPLTVTLLQASRATDGALPAAAAAAAAAPPPFPTAAASLSLQPSQSRMATNI